MSHESITNVYYKIIAFENNLIKWDLFYNELDNCKEELNYLKERYPQYNFSVVKHTTIEEQIE